MPAAGTGAGSSAISFQRFTNFLDQVAAKVGMTNENFAVDFYRAEPELLPSDRQARALTSPGQACT